MSYNAANMYKNPAARRNAVVERELDRELASVTLASARAEMGSGLLRVRWTGLAALFEKADKAFQGALPWNLTLSKEAWERVSAARKGGRNRGFIPREELGEVVVQKHARLSGWLCAAAKFRGLRKAIKAAVSPRGMNSPATMMNLWEVARKRPSPGQLERALWAVKERADGIVGSFVPGGHASWRAILKAVVFGPRHTGKAAIMAAARTLVPEASIRLYRDGRDTLAALAAAKVRDTSDGVEGRRTEAPVLDKMGVEVYPLFSKVTTRRGNTWFGLQKVFLVRRKADGRTYHSQIWAGARCAVKEALDAWKRQDAAAAEARLKYADLVAFLEGETTGYCPLFNLQDSYRVGNCVAGTAAWMADRGWHGRQIIAGRDLIPFLDFWRVGNVVRRRLADELVEAIAA